MKWRASTFYMPPKQLLRTQDPRDIHTPNRAPNYRDSNGAVNNILPTIKEDLP
jgi:hypothetical protein